MHAQLVSATDEAVAARSATLDVVAAFERFAVSMSAVHDAAVAARDLGTATIDRLVAQDDAIARLTSFGESWTGVALDAVHRTAEGQADALRRIASTTAAIAEHLASTSPPNPPADGLLVTVVLPVRDRHDELRRALGSVVAQSYRRWECIVVDDGSDDPVDEVVAGFGDPRIRVIRTDPAGPAAARNAGAAVAHGDVLAFLDSDNELFVHRLGALAQWMGARPWVRWALDASVIDDTVGRLPYVGNLRVPPAELQRTNFVDTGSICVRPDLYRQVGGFDATLDCLQDWDLARRLSLVEPPGRLPTIGFRYRDGGGERMTTTIPHGPPAHRIRRVGIGTPAADLRVLLAERHYPQLTETYIEAAVRSLLDLGAHVEVWSDEDVAAAFDPVVPVHRGELGDAIAGVEPDVVLSHWLDAGRDFRPASRAVGLPHVIRAHGFDFQPGLAAELLRDPDVLVHVFSHQAAQLGAHPHVTMHPIGFDPERYRPVEEKDRSLVVRVSAGLVTKDMDVFLEAAKRCPHHRFVLVLGRTFGGEEQASEILARAEALDSPAEIRVDVPHDEVAELIGRAGLYLHTHGTDHQLGMPISIAEAMATGAHVVARDLPSMDAYLGRAGARYRGDTVEARADHAAVLIHDTTRWTERRWREAWLAAVDEAWRRFPADLVMAAMVAEWREILGVGRRGR